MLVQVYNRIPVKDSTIYLLVGAFQAMLQSVRSNLGLQKLLKSFSANIISILKSMARVIGYFFAYERYR